jgi:hypothetical protein
MKRPQLEVYESHMVSNHDLQQKPLFRKHPSRRGRREVAGKLRQSLSMAKRRRRSDASV